MSSVLERALRIGESKQFRKFQKRVSEINKLEPELEKLDDTTLRSRFDTLRDKARNGESLDDLLPESFAITREVGRRTLEMRHFDVQLVGGMVLHSGSIAEMKTGEGKTLTATLAVVLNALAGKGVHLVTVNDYLAERDASWMRPIYETLGLSIGVLYNMQPYDEKQAAYQADITYGTNSEFGFDYLRDNMATSLEERVQRSHPFAIVDEVDNILIDEARTPLIISGAPEQAAEIYVQFAKLARQLTPGKRPDGMDPRQKKEFMAEYDYEFDEKHKTVSASERGVTKAEKFLRISHLYRAENGHLVNHLIQALKAESLYKRDVDYAVVDGEVKIIDEFTGRILDGRRWSEGLHQAVEAKEGVAIQEENQTLATITLQNYFRLYDKLAGMTGTALTEATEFMKIYKLPVVEIPTNQPITRKDENDLIYKTKEGKWSAVVREIVARHKNRQPVLVGTISVEVSELLSKQLKTHGIKHTVLNAKPEYAAREAEIVAEAGQPGAVTIATNMAGRGVDIKLGGNTEHLAKLRLTKENVDPESEEYEQRFADASREIEPKVERAREEVLQAGGLFILGTERHESRRIDNQLRGRAGRQGDPGESKFFLSAEDDLVRLFAGDRIYRILDRLGTEDEEGNEEPITAKTLSKRIEAAQKKVEDQHFLSRKNTLEYDDVMNEQRRIIYAYRNQILEGENIRETIDDELSKLIDRLVQEYTAADYTEEWDLDGLVIALEDVYPTELNPERIRKEQLDREGLTDQLEKEIHASYRKREEELGEELMRSVERYLLLQIIDQRWKEHLHDMDYLREGIWTRSFAEIKPIVAYKNEAYELFVDLLNSVWTDFGRMVFHVEVEVEGTGEQQPPSYDAGGSSTRPANVSYSSGTFGQPSVFEQAATEEETAAAEPAPVEQRVLSDQERIGRNDPCWCGSGKKFKKCHGATD